jgi:integrase
MSAKCQKTKKARFRQVADGIYRGTNNVLFERPWIDGKRTWRTLETENLKLAKEELHRRKAGVKKSDQKGTTVAVSCGDVIRRYQKDGYPDDQRQKRPGRSHELEEQHCLTLLPFWDEIPHDVVTNGTCDRFCDYRVKLIREAQRPVEADAEDAEDVTRRRDGTRAVDLDLNTLSNAFAWAMRAELVKANPVANRPTYHSESKVRHCRETMPHNVDELHQLAAVFLNRRSTSAGLGWQTLIEGLTGLRTCEALKLRTDAGPYEPGWITEDGKSLCVRRVKRQAAVNPFCAIHDGLRAVLDAHAAWKAQHYPDSPWFFPSPHDPTKPLGSTALARALLRLHDKAIGHKVTSHGLRAFYVLVRRSQGATDSQIAAELGHLTGGSTVEKVYGGVPLNWLNGGGPNLSWVPKVAAWEIPPTELAVAA